MFQIHHPRSAQVAGVVLILSSLLALAMMLMHPVIESETWDHAVQEISDKSAASAIVHGILIGLMAFFLYGHTALSISLGENGVLALAALVFYAFGILGYSQAALISGFVSPDLAARFAEGALSIETLRLVMILAYLANQTLAQFGLFATGVGIALWSMALWQQGYPKTGLLGLVIGLAPMPALLIGFLWLDVGGMTLVLLAQVIWNIVIGWFLFRTNSRTTP